MEQLFLSLNGIEVVYDDVILVLKGLSMKVNEGQVVVLLGANGAGKTTTLNAISGLLKAGNGAVTNGAIEFMGQRIDKMVLEQIVHLGIFQVTAGRSVFGNLTTYENLVAATRTRRNRKQIRERFDVVKGYFPVLKSRRNVLARELSGGEQQMLVIGRALMAQPRLMLLDEPSLGLSPILVSEIFNIIKKFNQEQNITVFLAEQNAHLALSIADYGYVMENGRMVLHDTVGCLRENDDIKMFYLGLTGMGAKRSSRGENLCRRRKRWLD